MAVVPQEVRFLKWNVPEMGVLNTCISCWVACKLSSHAQKRVPEQLCMCQECLYFHVVIRT